MKKIFIIVGIVLVIGVSFLIIPNFYIKNWKTYHSIKNGYSIEYPTYWNDQGGPRDYLIGLSSYQGYQGSYPPKGQVWIDIWVQELKTKTFDQLVDEVANANKTQKKEFEKIENADKAYIIGVKGGSYLYVKKGNNFFSIVEHNNGFTWRNRLDTSIILGSFKLD